MEKDKIDCNVLLIGGSAGSLEVLIKVIPKLKDHPSFSIVIILHRKSSEDVLLEQLIAHKTAIPVMETEDKVDLLPGYIYIAPSDYHLLFEKNGELSMDVSEKVNYSRPSIDVAFQSAAEVYGSGVVGLLLSGANSDGTEGLIAIREYGGIVAVQESETAEMPFMPQNAIDTIKPDYIVGTGEMADFINSLYR